MRRTPAFFLVVSIAAAAACVDDSATPGASAADASLDAIGADGSPADAAPSTDAPATDGPLADGAPADGDPGDGAPASDGGTTFVTFMHNGGGNETYTLAVNRATGAVVPVDMNTTTTAIEGILVGGGGATSFTTVGTHDRKYIYTADRTVPFLYGFSQDAAGKLTALTGGDGGVGLASCAAAPLIMAVAPSDKTLLVAMPNAVASYAIDSATGRLTFVNSQTTGAGGYGVGFDRSGSFAYVTNSTANTVSAYSIDGGTGALLKISAVDGGVDITSGGGAPIYALGHPTKDVLYVANSSDGKIGTFNIGPSGALTFVGATAGTVGALSLTMDAQGQRLYVATGFPDILVFDADPTTGALTPGPITTLTQNDVFGIALDPLAPLLYVGGNARFDTLRLASDGGAPQLLASDNGFYGPSPGRAQIAVNAAP